MLTIKNFISRYLRPNRKVLLFLLSAVLSFPLAFVASIAWFTVLEKKYSFRSLAYAAPFAFILLTGIIWSITKKFLVSGNSLISHGSWKYIKSIIVTLVILIAVASVVWMNLGSVIFNPPQFKHEIDLSPINDSTGEICILKIVNDAGEKIKKENNNIFEVRSTGEWVSQMNDCQFFLPGSSTGNLKFSYIGPLDDVLTFRLESKKESGQLLMRVNGLKAAIFNLRNEQAGHALRHLSLNYGASMIAWNMIGAAGLVAVIMVMLMIMFINRDWFLAWNSNRKFLDIYAIILITVLVILFFTITGTVTSGYHFTDDHEIVRITDDLSKESILTVAAKWIKRDLSIRFRPMYFFHRILETKVFGINFTAWSVYTMFLLLTSLLCFYYGMRKLKYSFFESLCFLIIVFIGPQSAIWWRLGPNETIGMVFLGLAFYFMVNCEKRYLLNTYLFCFFLICASLCKESFTIIVPAFFVFKIWHEKELNNLSVKKAILKNRVLFIPFIVMIINLLIIVFVVGTNRIGYAGVDSGIFHLLKGIFSIIKQFEKYIIMVAILFGIICFSLNDKRKILLFSKKMTFPFLICTLIVAPNLVLYAKSGMWERYLLPSLVGIAFFIISLIKEIRQDFSGFSSLILTIILVFSMKPEFLLALNSARGFANEGNQTKKFLSEINANYEESSNVLLVADPVGYYELSFSIETYLSLTRGIELYTYAVERSWSDMSDFEKNLTSGWHSYFNQRMLSDMKGKPDMILFFDKTLDERFFYESGIQKERYSNILKDTGYRYAIFNENR